MVDGKQYVVVPAGGGQSSRKPTGGMYIAYALP
jgi:glucose dehydrogenase